MNTGREQLAFALDVADLTEAKRLIALLRDEVGVFKVGLELFTAIGPDAIRAVHDAGAACFLDLKLHDIPATVGRAVSAAAQLGVEFLTLHAAGGPEALRQAAQRVQGTRTRLLAITVLTSLGADDLAAIGLGHDARVAVTRFAQLAQSCGVSGLVCSAQEASALRALLGPAAFIVTPGIREAGAPIGDQQRTEGPAEAITAGSNLLVVGRPIRDAVDPVAAARRFRQAIVAAQT